MRCDIIIPIWNQLEFTRDCIENLIKNTEYPYRFILIDNASDNKTRVYLESLKEGRPLNLELIRNEENLGFVKAVNQGLKTSDAPYVCILNNDAVPAPGWLTRMIDFAQTHKDVGLINPQCNGHLNTPINLYAKMLEKHKDEYMEMNQCQGFCMLIKREVIDRIGYLDEAFGIGGFDDTDYSMRAGLAGYRSACIRSSYVYHREHVSFDAMGDRKRLVSKGEKEYFKKWPRHLRVGMAFLLNDDIPDGEIENFLKSVLSLARAWCWVNLWVFGNVEKNRARIATVSRKINMPVHQNIKLKFLPARYKALHILIRLIERSFGTKKRKRYDAVLINDESLLSLLKIFHPLHGADIQFVEFKIDTNKVDNFMIKLRGTK